jgi:restriction endonuclease Mrr
MSMASEVGLAADLARETLKRIREMERKSFADMVVDTKERGE